MEEDAFFNCDSIVTDSKVQIDAHTIVKVQEDEYFDSEGYLARQEQEQDIQNSYMDAFEGEPDAEWNIY